MDLYSLCPSLSVSSSADIAFLGPSTASYPPPLPRCVFLPDNGAFFINYVITAALLGTGMELMRLGSLFTYCTRLFLSRSEPERVHIRKVRANLSLSIVFWEGKQRVIVGARTPRWRPVTIGGWSPMESILGLQGGKKCCL